MEEESNSVEESKPQGLASRIFGWVSGFLGGGGDRSVDYDDPDGEEEDDDNVGGVTRIFV